MKILQVTNFFKPSWEAGGVTRVAYEISKHLADLGHEVTVYTTNRSIYPLDVKSNFPYQIDKMRVYYFENLRKFIPWGKLMVLPYYHPFIARKQIKNFDIIHIHEHRTILAFIVSYYATRNNIPYVVQSHGSVLPKSQKEMAKRIFDILFGNRILSNACALIALSESEMTQYTVMGVPPKKIAIIPNGINISDYEKLPEPGNFRERIQNIKNKKIILYVGRITHSKGLDLLIKAFHKVLLESSDVVLIFVGPDDGYKSDLIQIIEELKITDNTIFMGFISQQEKISAFIDADVFITPRFSGFPITFLEACACGCPIITTHAGDTLDWIDMNVGLIAEYNSDSLAAAIEKIIYHQDLRDKFSVNAKKIVTDRFEWGKIVQNLEKLYSDVTGTYES